MNRALLTALTLSMTALLPLAAAQTLRVQPRTLPAQNSAAQNQVAQNPAALNGIWRVQSLSVKGEGRGLVPAGQLTVVNGKLSGTFGCSRFAGTLSADQNTVRIQSQTVPPAAGSVRCLFVVRASLVDALNSVSQYTVSPRHLFLFSDRARVVLERVGFVTPARR